MENEYWWFFLLAFVAEILGTVSGFGSSILFVPIAAMFFDFKTVLGVTAIFHVFSNLSKIALFRKGIKKDVAIKLGVPAIIFVIIGALKQLSGIANAFTKGTAFWRISQHSWLTAFRIALVLTPSIYPCSRYQLAFFSIVKSAYSWHNFFKIVFEPLSLVFSIFI